MTLGTGMGTGMGSASQRTITAFFDSRDDADDAIDRLVDSGISRDRIRLVPGYERDSDDARPMADTSQGFWDSLRDLFLPDEDRSTYAEGLRRGGYLISVDANEAEYERVLDILDDEGTIDIDERADSWRAEGWSGSTMGTTGGAPASLSSADRTAGATASSGASGMASGSTGKASDAMRARDEDVIPVAEEELRVGKRDVNHGRLRVRSYVVETPVNESVNLREERVEVERRPVDRALGDADRAFQERTIEAEERGEEAVVSKEARVKEELVLRKNVEERTENVSDTVRSTKVEVEDERGSPVSRDGTTDRRS